MLRLMTIFALCATGALGQIIEVKAIDGEGEVCPLEEVVISEPPDGATIYLGADAGPTDIPVQAQVSCIADTEKVEFFVKRPADTSALSLGSAFASPFTVILQDILPSATPQAFTFTAEATPKADEENTITGTSVLNIVQVSTTQDADSNSLPDDPFATLDAVGDRWVSSGSFSGATAKLISAALVVYGDDAKQSSGGAVTITLSPPGGTGQVVELSVPRSAVADDEVGVVIVQAAVDLGSLAGTVEAGNFAREPSGRIEEDGIYAAVSVIVSDDDGRTFTQAPAARLASNPIKLAISGLELDDTREYVVAQHVSTIADTTGGIQLRHATGTWRQPAVQALDEATGRFTADLSSFGVSTVYFLVDDSGACGDGGCPSTLLWIELLMGLAFFILSLADGGVGGGDGPCFIATAAYGTPMAGEIEVLRGFRDGYLLDSGVGTAFVDAYYRLSPTVADWVAQSSTLAALVRLILAPVLFAVQHPLGMLGLLAAGLLVAVMSLPRFRKPRLGGVL